MSRQSFNHQGLKEAQRMALNMTKSNDPHFAHIGKVLNRVLGEIALKHSCGPTRAFSIRSATFAARVADVLEKSKE
jgi:recombinational DNA repair protein RecR